VPFKLALLTFALSPTQIT